jgi:hypothetical protein
METQILTNEKLFQKLGNFSLDNPEASFSFSDRLSRENGWSKEFSLKVIDEYKKFVYLSVISGKSLTPSEEVDQAWHLHMIYTQSYWSEMCGKILNGLKLHHGPTKGGQAEKERYDNQYDYTLQVYKEEFGYDAPSDIWPAKEERFGNVNFRRVSVRDNIILNKNKVKIYLGGFLISSGLIAFATLLSSFSSNNEKEMSVGEIFSWFLGIVLLVFLIRGIFRYSTRHERNNYSSSSKRNNYSSSSKRNNYSSSSKRNDNNNNSGCSSGGCTITSSFFGCGTSGCGSSSSSSGCGSSGCGSSGCGGGGCGGGGCGS